ncbi:MULTISPECIES: GNAT family N-acetyltransferase [Gordonia]|uniref:N-acetyltransferase domain-containing protein n=1 Tax=Gordonia sputi NBRC 100414 TaxID=1089453 RepID=H5U305_9ACTN|nr:MULTISPECIES: GNAT family N-acetyltransferase [Gordonia]NKY95874.1 GNAT family N-acetyltransferase [Gordonia sputi]OBA36454.1 GCN5 family acetyltransferase [Gordonia sp. 852002-51296_SCH5728562-b]GAB40113.1 hypothetical protein GOSPT_088_00270 [Gordonia sputi NBRC 100414]
MASVLPPDGPVRDETVLDNPARSALLGPHSRFAQTHGDALRYPADVAPWCALPDDPTISDWEDAAELVGPDGSITLATVTVEPPEGWTSTMRITGVQMIGAAVEGYTDPRVVELDDSDVDDMLDLVERTRPGPFRRHTIDLGTYLGIRRDGKLIAMAGERMHPPGWSEVSAVCTDPAFRGEGLARAVVLAVVEVIRERGDLPFLHASADNVSAIRLYENVGFTRRRKAIFQAVRAPQ